MIEVRGEGEDGRKETREGSRVLAMEMTLSLLTSLFRHIYTSVTTSLIDLGSRFPEKDRRVVKASFTRELATSGGEFAIEESKTFTLDNDSPSLLVDELLTLLTCALKSSKDPEVKAVVISEGITLGGNFGGS